MHKLMKQMETHIIWEKEYNNSQLYDLVKMS